MSSATDPEEQLCHIGLFEAINISNKKDGFGLLSYCTQSDKSPEEIKIFLKHLLFGISWTPKMLELFNNLSPDIRLLVLNAEISQNKPNQHANNQEYHSEPQIDERTEYNSPSPSSQKGKGKGKVDIGMCPRGCGEKVKIKKDGQPYKEHVCPTIDPIETKNDNDENNKKKEKKEEKKEKKEKEKKKRKKKPSSNANNSEDEENNDKKKENKNTKPSSNANNSEDENDNEHLDPHQITFDHNSDDEDEDE